MSDGWDRSTVDMPGGVALPAVRNQAPERLGRYEITEPIAGGGMGFVYAAYDPELDRKVALKVVHPRRSRNPGSHSRLIKEARALARLDHPNVVKVHDVFSHDEQIVVVMELVSGETLAEWEATKPRTWREIVDVYAQAGDGLAAAHALEIVHRDFKPQNAIIGTDGRVRVLDFGLARMTADDAGESDDAAASGAITQTVPGAVMGTPAYSAPEQLEGGVATLASDQFSFCVALHRALEGNAPFAGESISALVLAIRSAPPATSDRAVPVWLRALVQRGLEPNPTRRHPSMDALLVGLKKPRGWKRWRWPAVVTFLVATAGVTSFSIRGNASSVVPCDGGEITSVWDPASRLAAGVAIEKAGTPYAHEVADKVLGGMDSHARAWSEAHRGACMAHRGGASSDPMFDRETSCLAQKLGEIKSAVSVLEGTTEKSLSGAADVAAGMHDANTCLDVSRLLNDSVPPPEVRARVAVVRDHINMAAALRRAGRLDESESAIDAAIIDAKATPFSPVLAEAQLELGRILIADDDVVRAAPVLRDAMQTSLANNLPQLAVEASARRIYAEGRNSPDLERLARDFDFSDALSRSVPDDHFGRALLLNNVGVVYADLLRNDEALKFYASARDVIKDDKEPDIELTCIDLNIGMQSRDPEARVRALSSVVSRRSAVLGEHHPSSLQAKYYLSSFGIDPKVALAALGPLCPEYARSQAGGLDQYIQCERDTALYASVVGDSKLTRQSLSAVAASSELSMDDAAPLRHLARGELAYLNGDKVTATRELSEVVSEEGGKAEWWKRAEAYEAETYLGKMAGEKGDLSLANSTLRAAVDGFEQIRKSSYALAFKLRADEARNALEAASKQIGHRRN